MLARQLDPIRIEDNTPYAHLCQSFALAHLASYNNPGPQAHVWETSFYRAFAINNFVWWPRVPGGRPAVVMAYIPYGLTAHLVVAVEGMTSLSQIWSAWTGAHTYVPVPNLPGVVHGTFKSYADDILALVYANSYWANVINERTTFVTFCGFSMGAAVAEIMAYTHRKTYRSQAIFCHKFGAPRFASDIWVNRRDAGVSHQSIYLGGDPVTDLLVRGMTRTSDGVFGMPNGVTENVLDPNAESWTLFGERDGVPPPISNRSALHSYAQSRQAITNANPWRNHLGKAYRYMFCRYASRSADLLNLRMLYLEYPDESNWQLIWRNLTPPDFSGLEILIPPPPSYDDIRASQMREFHRGVPDDPDPPRRNQPAVTQNGMQRITTIEQAGNRRLRRVDPVGALPGN